MEGGGQVRVGVGVTIGIGDGGEVRVGVGVGVRTGTGHKAPRSATSSVKIHACSARSTRSGDGALPRWVGD